METGVARRGGESHLDEDYRGGIIHLARLESTQFVCRYADVIMRRILNNIKECIKCCQVDRNCQISAQRMENTRNDSDVFLIEKILEFD